MGDGKLRAQQVNNTPPIKTAQLERFRNTHSSGEMVFDSCGFGKA
jgi:hypothetical protein